MKKNHQSIALIGFGYWGKKIYRILKTHFCYRFYQLDYILDPIFKHKKFDLPDSISLFHSEKDFFNTAKPDIIFIASPFDEHLRFVQYALKNNIHCFVEKPFAISLFEAENILSLSYNNPQTIFFPGYIFAFDDRVNKFVSFFHQQLKNSSIEISKLCLYYSHPCDREPVEFALLPHLFFLLFNQLNIPYPNILEAKKFSPLSYQSLIISLEYLSDSFPDIELHLIKRPIKSFEFKIIYYKKSLLKFLSKPKPFSKSGSIFRPKKTPLYHFPFVKKCKFPPHIKNHFLPLYHSFSSPLKQLKNPSTRKKPPHFDSLYHEILAFFESIENQINPYHPEDLLKPFHLEFFEIYSQVSKYQYFHFKYRPIVRTQLDSPKSITFNSLFHSDFIPPRYVLLNIESITHPHIFSDKVQKENNNPPNNFPPFDSLSDDISDDPDSL